MENSSERNPDGQPPDAQLHCPDTCDCSILPPTGRFFSLSSAEFLVANLPPPPAAEIPFLEG